MDLDLLTIKSALELYFSISVANAILIFAALVTTLGEAISEICEKIKQKKAKKE